MAIVIQVHGDRNEGKTTIAMHIVRTLRAAGLDVRYLGHSSASEGLAEKVIEDGRPLDMAGKRLVLVVDQDATDTRYAMERQAV